MLLREGYFQTVTNLTAGDAFKFVNNVDFGAQVRDCNGTSFLTSVVPNGGSRTISVADLLANNNKGFRPACFTGNGGAAIFVTKTTTTNIGAGLAMLRPQIDPLLLGIILPPARINLRAYPLKMKRVLGCAFHQ